MGAYGPMPHVRRLMASKSAFWCLPSTLFVQFSKYVANALLACYDNH